MKLTKRFIAFLMSVAMCIGILSITAFATEVPENESNFKLDDVVQNLPDDAVILYQGVDGIIYQSKGQGNNLIHPQSTNAGEMNYNSVWLTQDDVTGNFYVKNTNRYGTVYGTIRLESSSDRPKAWIRVACNTSVSGDVRANAGDVYFCLTYASSENVTVHYEANDARFGLRINCWVYTDRPDKYDELPKL